MNEHHKQAYVFSVWLTDWRISFQHWTLTALDNTAVISRLWPTGICFQVVQGTQNSVELSYLNSLTEYQVAVFAVYRSAASEALRGSATTCKFICLRIQTDGSRRHSSKHHAASDGLSIATILASSLRHVEANSDFCANASKPCAVTLQSCCLWGGFSKNGDQLCDQSSVFSCISSVLSGNECSMFVKLCG